MRKFTMMVPVILIGMAFFFNVCSAGSKDKDLIEKVKNIYFVKIDKNVTVGKAFDTYKYFKKTNWTAFKDRKDRNYVQFVGSIDLDKKKLINQSISDEINQIQEINVVAQFIVNNDDTIELKFFGTEILTNDGEKASEGFSERGSILKTIYQDQDLAYALAVHAILIHRDQIGSKK
jgi:hypothetical protein